MTVNEFKQEIRSRKPKSFYCLTGEEIGIRNIYIHKLAEFINARLVYIDKVSDIMSNATNNSLFAERRVYVVYDDEEFLKHEEVWEQFSNGTMLDNDILVLVFNSLDKRSKFYKTYDLSIVEFNRLNEAILSVYVQREISLSDKNTKLLIEACESDYSRIMLEIDKIKHYVNTFRLTDDAQKYDVSRWNIAFEQLLDDGTIYLQPYDAIFDFVDAVLRHQVKRAYELYENCKGVNENTLALLSVLYTNAKQMLQVMACPKDADPTQSAGLTAWQVKCARERIGFYRIGDLVYIMRIVQDTEKKIKQGLIEDSVAIDYVLASIL